MWSRAIPQSKDVYRPEHHYMRGPGPRWREARRMTEAGTNEATPDHEPGLQQDEPASLAHPKRTTRSDENRR